MKLHGAHLGARCPRNSRYVCRVACAVGACAKLQLPAGSVPGRDPKLRFRGRHYCGGPRWASGGNTAAGPCPFRVRHAPRHHHFATVREKVTLAPLSPKGPLVMLIAFTTSLNETYTGVQRGPPGWRPPRLASCLRESCFLVSSLPSTTDNVGDAILVG